MQTVTQVNKDRDSETTSDADSVTGKQRQRQ